MKVKPYELPINDILKAFKPYVPKKWKPEAGEQVSLVLQVKVFRDFEDGTVDVHDDAGNCLRVSKIQLVKSFFEQNNNYTMKAMKDACLTVAKQLAKANNTVTTLEIKNELRRDYPYYFWQQQTVSDYMSQLAADGVFTYTDNGSFRVYSLATPAQVAATAGPVSTAINTTLSKVAGRIPTNSLAQAQTQSAPRRRGRPRKTGTTIRPQDVLNFAAQPNFEAVTIDRRGTPTYYTKADIKAQKKSPVGYIGRSVQNVLAITVGGSTYAVK